MEDNGGKSVILKNLYEQVQKIQCEGCGPGLADRAVIKELCRRMGDVENKFFAILLLLISNLAATVTVILRGH